MPHVCACLSEEQLLYSAAACQLRAVKHNFLVPFRRRFHLQPSVSAYSCLYRPLPPFLLLITLPLSLRSCPLSLFFTFHHSSVHTCPSWLQRSVLLDLLLLPQHLTLTTSLTGCWHRQLRDERNWPSDFENNRCHLNTDCQRLYCNDFSDSLHYDVFTKFLPVQQ